VILEVGWAIQRLRSFAKVNTFTFAMSKGEQTRQRIVERALELFASRGFAETTMLDIAEAAGVSTGLAYRYFARKEELVLALYERLSEEVAQRLRLPEGSVGTRWAALERTRFTVLGPHRRTLLALVQAALDPDGELGVMSAATAHVRARWLELHCAAVAGATDSPAAPEQLARLLYAVDLLLVLFWTQDRTTNCRATRAAIDRLAPLVDGVVRLMRLGVASGVVGDFGSVLQSLARKMEKSS
jgi:AcrR family transcriptional regulator